MPRSFSSAAAFCIVSMSLFEPMMIPTSGVSTSRPSNSCSGSLVATDSRWGVVSALPSGRSPSGGSTVSSLNNSCLHSVHGARGDVAALLLSIEIDLVRGLVRQVAGGGGARPHGGHVQHAAAGGGDIPVFLGRARVQHLGAERPRLLDAGDDVALRRRGRVAGAGLHHGHRPVG